MNAPYLLADDLSGALEAGAAYRAVGWKVVLSLQEAPPSPQGAAWLEVVSSETRSMNAPDAALRVRRVIAVRRASGARLLYKKIDSTLRGPLGAEVRALIDELAPRLVVICPANPAVGRTVVEGVVYVKGIRLEETDFRHDPVWPARTGDVRDRCAEQGLVVTGHIPLTVVTAGEAAVRAHVVALCGTGQVTSVLIGDAASESDIRTLVRALRAVAPDTVFVGSAALGSVLAETCPPPEMSRDEVQPVAGPMAVLCGSRHPASHRQIARFAQACDAAVLQLSSAESLAGLVDAAVIQLESGRHFAVKCDPAVTPPNPSAVAGWLAEMAVRVLARRSPGSLYLTGGETADAVCRRVGGQHLEILREIEIGVILARLERGPLPSVDIITKPGGFGDDDVILRNIHEIRMLQRK